MKAAVVTAYGGPGVLQIREVPAPVPSAGQILVRVRAFGLNFADLYGRMGIYPGSPRPPFIPGLEFSGDVVRTGDGVARFSGGERVMGYCRWGSHADYVALDERHAVQIPSSMGYADGAAFVATGMTAYHGLVRLACLRPGERLLVHAAAGGVGLAVLQMGKGIGAEIFATAGTDEKVTIARRYGADHCVNYRTTDFEREVRHVAGPGGIDVVMDGVGGPVFRKGWRLLGSTGRYVLFGLSSVTGSRGLNRLRAAVTLAKMGTVLPATLLSVNKALFGFNLGTMRGQDQYLAEAAEEIVRWNARGLLRPVVGRTFPFERVAEAHAYLQTGRSYGKVVVLNDGAE